MAQTINVTLALSPDAYERLKHVSNYTNISRSEVVNRLILAHADQLKTTDDTSTTQTPEQKNRGDQPIVPVPATQNPKYDFFTKTDRLILEDDPGDELTYGPIED